jgi:transposase
MNLVVRDDATVPVYSRAQLNRSSRLGCSTATEETMRCLGIDVHVSTTVWCLVNELGEVGATGKVPTTQEGLSRMLCEVGGPRDLVIGQEVGKMTAFVQDVLVAHGGEIKSFNAHHLRMIASSRKKTDRRDAFWIAKALQTGMTPHPVYVPTGEIRQLRRLLSRRAAIVDDRRRWLLRARSYLHAAGLKPRAGRSVGALLNWAMESSTGIEADLHEAVSLCERLFQALQTEQERIEKTLFEQAAKIEAIRRLMTIRGVGIKVATMVYAWIGDVKRFPDARALASYVGLVPSVHQSGTSSYTGHITKQGSSRLRSLLVQSGHLLLLRCRGEDARPLRSIAERVHTGRGRRKIAVVAGARHVLRIAYYILRDGTSSDPSRLSGHTAQETEGKMDSKAA